MWRRITASYLGPLASVGNQRRVVLLTLIANSNLRGFPGRKVNLSYTSDLAHVRSVTVSLKVMMESNLEVFNAERTPGYFNRHPDFNCEGLTLRWARGV